MKIKDSWMNTSAARVALRHLASVDHPLEGLPRRKVLKIVNHLISKVNLKGFFHDESWRPINAIWDLFHREDIPFAITNSEYQKERIEGQSVDVRKVWKFEVPFTNGKGRPDKVYGYVAAAGAGPVDDPLKSYDVTAYVS